ncbi:ZIP family metal transporter [Clostridium niameyense]|uniref:ZIP family metal transporter n=1 Tax=Clostridium niameyense TaxID=1622073 RepID=UPI00067E7F40|nr:ZIP family metal transporter [Clostridium niameyense]
MLSNTLYFILIGGFVSLVGTVLGALIGVSIKNPSNKLLSKLVAFSGGLMMAIVVFDLIPEALKKWHFPGVVLFCILGIIIIMFVDNKTNSININEHKKVAFLTSIGIMLHNFPEGIIMGCGFAAGNNLGIKMAIIIAIHDIPEGIAVAAPLIASKENVVKTFLYVVFTALPTCLGTFFGAFIVNISNLLLGMFISLAAGIMLYVVCMDMIPEAAYLGDKKISFIYGSIGVIIGLIIINIL